MSDLDIYIAAPSPLLGKKKHKKHQHASFMHWYAVLVTNTLTTLTTSSCWQAYSPSRHVLTHHGTFANIDVLLPGFMALLGRGIHVGNQWTLTLTLAPRGKWTVLVFDLCTSRVKGQTNTSAAERLAMGTRLVNVSLSLCISRSIVEPQLITPGRDPQCGCCEWGWRKRLAPPTWTMRIKEWTSEFLQHLGSNVGMDIMYTFPVI